MNETQQPRNIFEVINLNIVDLSKDVCHLAEQIAQIHAALYPQSTTNNNE
jgi:hypothetical protein